MSTFNGKLSVEFSKFKVVVVDDANIYLQLIRVLVKIIPILISLILLFENAYSVVSIPNG